MGQDYKLIGKNIRALRMYYGEKQSDLASAINVSFNAISQYENGRKDGAGIPMDSIEAIAKHYRVTVEALTESDYSLEVLKKDFCFNDSLIILDYAFPVLCSKKAKANSDFVKGYSLVERIKDKENQPSIESYHQLYDGIYSSIRAMQCGIVEGAANALFLICIYISMLSVPSEVVGTELKGDNVQDEANTLKKLYLMTLSDEDDKSRTEFLGKMQKEIEKCLVCLRSSKKYCDLAYHYVATMYFYGFVKSNTNNPERDREIGMEMLINNCTLENEYSLYFMNEVIDRLFELDSIN